MKKIIILFIFSLFILSGGRVFAASPTASPSSDLRKAIKERIEEAVTKTDTEVSRQRWLGVVGTVQAVSSSTVSVRDVSGTVWTVNLVDGSKLLDSKGKALKQSDLSVDSLVWAAGQASNDVILDAKRMMVRAAAPVRMVAVGTITELKSASLSLAPRGGGESLSLSTTSRSKYENNDGATLERKSLQSDEAVVVVYTESESGAKTLLRLRQLAPTN